MATNNSNNSANEFQSPAQGPGQAALPNYAPIVSSHLIGSLLNFFLFGTLLLQIYVYRVYHQRDRFLAKFLVLTASTVINGVDAEYWFGSGYGYIGRFADPRESRLYTPLMGSFITMLVQIFFCYRIVALKHKTWPLALLVGLIALAQCAGGMGSGILSYMVGDEAQGKENMCSIFVWVWLVGGAVADVLIAITMTCLLITAPSSRDPRDCLKTTVRYVVETNIFAAVVALVGLLLYVGAPDTLYFVCPTMILPGVYANTLLAALNARPASSNITHCSTCCRSSSSPCNTYTTPASGVGSEMRWPAARMARTRSTVSKVYSAESAGRVLSVPAMSFARKDGKGEREGEEEVKRGSKDSFGGTQGTRERSSMERKWCEEEDSESEYGDDADEQV
ncbi:hypothetical protein C8R43DRAFT_1128734 [Mycena crocata]|nr:hypothetical protein C8R43DRAFT_1128734 [Mycena crocata]